MFDHQQQPSESERAFSWRRIRIIVIGTVAMLFLGITAVVLYTSSQYGSTPFDFIFKGKPKSAVGKAAYYKDDNRYIGVIKSEGYSTRRGADVYYIETIGGSLVEVQKYRVEVREPQAGQK